MSDPDPILVSASRAQGLKDYEIDYVREMLLKHANEGFVQRVVAALDRKDAPNE